MDEIAKLLPCPFCGGEASLDTEQDYRIMTTGDIDDMCAISCTECDAYMGWCYRDVAGTHTREDVKLELITRWNKRTSATALSNLIRDHEALKAKTLAVIEPFAEEANLIDADDTKPIWSVITIWSTTAKPLIVGHLRAARALADELKENG